MSGFYGLLYHYFERSWLGLREADLFGESIVAGLISISTGAVAY